MDLRALEKNQSESWKCPGNLFLKKGTITVHFLHSSSSCLTKMLVPHQCLTILQVVDGNRCLEEMMKFYKTNDQYILGMKQWPQLHCVQEAVC